MNESMLHLKITDKMENVEIKKVKGNNPFKVVPSHHILSVAGNHIEFWEAKKYK